MKKHDFPGLFIVFEGLDGSGSSTQVELLVKKLNFQGLKAFPSKEPTNNLIGGLIRGVLTKEWSISDDGLQLLFAADRSHNLKRHIVPAISKGKVIVSDRYVFSSIAFGSINLPKHWLEHIYENFVLPDITFYLKVSPSKCIERIAKSRSEFELFEEKSKLEKVSAIYEELAKDPVNNIFVVNGNNDRETVSQEIFSIIKQTLAKKGILLEKQKEVARW